MTSQLSKASETTDDGDESGSGSAAGYEEDDEDDDEGTFRPRYDIRKFFRPPPNLPVTYRMTQPSSLYSSFYVPSRTSYVNVPEDDDDEFDDNLEKGAAALIERVRKISEGDEPDPFQKVIKSLIGVN